MNEEELKYQSALDLIEELDRLIDWHSGQLSLREEILRRLQFAEDNGVLEE